MIRAFNMTGTNKEVTKIFMHSIKFLSHINVHQLVLQNHLVIAINKKTFTLT